MPKKGRQNMGMRLPRGFTLLELMVVVVIVGILATVAYPSYLNVVIKSNRSVARAALVDIAARQESFYAQNKTYASDLAQLGFPTDTIFLQDDGGISGNDRAAPGDSIYLLLIVNGSASARGFTAEAQHDPGLLQRNDLDCGDLQINAQGDKTSEFGTNCW